MPSRQTFAGSIVNNALTNANVANVIVLPVSCYMLTFILRLGSIAGGANLVNFSLWDDSPQVNLLFGEAQVGPSTSGAQSITTGTLAADGGVSYALHTRLPRTATANIAGATQTIVYRIRLNGGTATLLGAYCDCEW